GLYARLRLTRAALTALAAVLLVLPGSASAATFQVTTTGDPGPAPCGAGSCSLRGAVLAANANGPDEDVIALGKGDYKLTGGQLVVTGSLRLAGAGSRRTVIDPSRSPGQNRSLDIRPSSPVTVTVSGLT